MVELVAERGYATATVRELAQLAGVSTRTFYQHYPNKEECFLSVQQLITRRLLRSLAASQIGGQDQVERVGLAVDALVREWANRPKAARLMLVEANLAGPRALKQERRALQSMEARITGHSNGGSGRPVASSLITDGIVAGLTNFARSRILREEINTLLSASEGLARWAKSCYEPMATERLAGLNPIGITARHAKFSSVAGNNKKLTQSDDLALLLSAASKLAAAGDFQRLTSRKIFVAAGVPRRSFYANFSHVTDCLLAALEQRAYEALASAREVSERATTPSGRVYRAVSYLCSRIAEDAALANLCFSEAAEESVQGMCCQDQLMAGIRDLVMDAMTGASLHVDNLAIEASVGALWGILQHEVVMAREHQLPALTPTLSYLVLAPIIGGVAAVDAICDEATNDSSKSEAYRL
jgi:AcrR family transcriptional regulator